MRSHLGRPIDFRIPSNRNVALLTLGWGGAVLAWNVAQGVDVLEASRLAFNGAAAVFLAWAITRELHPDCAGSATVASMATTGVWVALGTVGLAASAAVLLAARVAIRSTGKPPLPIDQVASIGIAAWAGTTFPGWIAGLALAYALARDVRLPDGARARQLAVAGATAAVTTMSLIVSQPAIDGAYPITAVVLVVLAVVGYALAEHYEPITHGDYTNVPLDKARKVSARRIALAALLVATVLTGLDGAAALGPVVGSFVGMALADVYTQRRTAG